MNVLSSECSSGCESGWTSYLVQSFCSDDSNDKKSGFCDEYRKGHKGKEEVVVVVDDDEEEDLSMVSDASSGPPHFYEDDDDHHYTVPKVAAFNKNGGKRHRNKEQQLPSLHDDTASSPLINLQNNFGHTNNTQASMEESGFHYHPQGFSATTFRWLANLNLKNH
ncbi:protein SOB FIVE-LIKE 6-like [Hibiscus syriacus]|uniref:protein SOB FIVE-LIKE 6-like n=1 Tax=Hibiscus syriacus TaxID=106335 RepID=UPI001923AF5E|nr:protein SOB FIVE-LIKE 6-like [Hibiscus syriacus]